MADAGFPEGRLDRGWIAHSWMLNQIQDYAKQRVIRHQVMCRPATKGTVITS